MRNAQQPKLFGGFVNSQITKSKWAHAFLSKKTTSVKRLGRDRKINGKKGKNEKNKGKKTGPLCVARKCVRTESQRHGYFFPENDSSCNFYRIQFLKNENCHSCEEYIRVVCTRRPPVVLVWCFRFPALWWNIAVTLIIEKEDHQILSISLSESFDDLGVISSLIFFRQSFVNFIKCYSREWTSADMSNYYVFVTFMNRPHPSSFW